MNTTYHRTDSVSSSHGAHLSNGFYNSSSWENSLLIGQLPARSDQTKPNQTKLDPHFTEGPEKANGF